MVPMTAACKLPVTYTSGETRWISLAVSVIVVGVNVCDEASKELVSPIWNEHSDGVVL